MINSFSFKSLDIFSQPIQFNSIEQTSKKKTTTGALLSVVVLLTSLSYFIYESYLYFGNKINPIFRSQAFVRNDLITVDLKEELVAFQFIMYRTLPVQQQFDPNKTYISYIAIIQIQRKNEYELVALDVVQCQSPLLQGYLCIDFTKLENKKLVHDLSSQMLSQVVIYTYRCTDTDQFKTFVPDNCAKPEEIDAYISQQNYIMSYKVQQQQFNTTSKQMDLNYKNQFSLINLSQLTILEFKIQQQETEVIDGSFIQQTSSFTSPVSFYMGHYTMDYAAYCQMKNSKYFVITGIEIDEQVLLTKIKYPTFPEVLAICNSTFALLMCLGYIARKLSFSLLKDQMLLMYMQNIFQGQYINILQQNKIVELNSIDQYEQSETDSQSDEQFNQIYIPNMNVKQSGRIMNSKNQVDFILEKFDERKEKDICLTESISTEGKFINNSAESNYKQNEQEIINFNWQINQNQTERNQTEREPLSKNSNFSFSHPNSSVPNKIRANSSVTNKIRIPMIQGNYFKKSKDSFRQIQKIQNPGAQSQQLQQLEVSNKKNLFENLKERQRAYSNLHISQKIENILFKFKLKDKRGYQQSIGLNPKTKQLIEGQMQKNLDFIHLQKEILFLKKAIMILLSKDQFAMIPLIGCSEKSIDYLFNSQNSNQLQQDEKKLNHFEELLRLSWNHDSQNEQITQFLIRCNNQSSLSEIDQRILQSVV